MLESVALVMVGFSLGAAALLALVGATVHAQMELAPLARVAGFVLLGALAALQVEHGRALLQPVAAGPSSLYVAGLFVAAGSFLLFFRGVLQPRDHARAWHALALLPVLCAWLLPGAVALPLAFACGAGYATWLALLAHRLREQRRRFRLERGVFIAQALIALLVLVCGLAAPWIGLHWFRVAYAILIGAGLFAALYLLLRFPDLPARAAEAVAGAYAVSTLTRVDREAALARLRRVMEQDRAWLDENLSLSGLAALVELTPHQLSELINTQFQFGFARYVRGHRVEAARRMLLAEPTASVLAVGLAVGFTSQSTFYAAFREITGEVPGRYRRQAAQRGERC